MWSEDRQRLSTFQTTQTRSPWHTNKQTLGSLYTGVYTCAQTIMGLHNEMHLKSDLHMINIKRFPEKSHFSGFYNEIKHGNLDKCDTSACHFVKNGWYSWKINNHWTFKIIRDQTLIKWPFLKKCKLYNTGTKKLIQACKDENKLGQIAQKLINTNSGSRGDHGLKILWYKLFLIAKYFVQFDMINI